MIGYRKLGRFGRLGNQLFQIASTIGIAKKHNRDYMFPNWEYNKYFKGYIENRSISLTGMMMVNISESELDKINSHKYVNLTGYYQDEKYFKEYEDIIREMFYPTKSTYYEVFNKYPKMLESTSIHVRRGDYLKHPDCHPNLTIDYYKRAMDILPGPYILCSDDIEWCEKEFKDYSDITL